MHPELVMSIVLAKVSEIDLFKIVLDKLNKQTLASDMELIILVGSESERQEIMEQSSLDNIGRVTYLVVGPIEDYEVAHAYGYWAAQAPIAANIEDHVYPEADWVEAHVSAHQDDWAAVSTTIVNANPASLWSWVSFLLAYGYWTDPAHYGETHHLGRVNISYKRNLLLRYGDELKDMIGRGGDLQERVRADGGRFYLTNRSSIAHLNTSKFYPSVKLLFNTGRIYAAQQSVDRQWPFLIRLFAALCTPLFPFIRFIRRHNKMFHGSSLNGQRIKMYTAFYIGLVSNAVGNAVGYLMGAGQSKEKTALYDMERFDHITSRDYQQLLSSEFYDS